MSLQHEIYPGLTGARGAIHKLLDELEDDKRRLDWIESQSDGTAWVARQSSVGRGFRLHNVGQEQPIPWKSLHKTAREAIDAAIAAQLPTVEDVQKIYRPNQ